MKKFKIQKGFIQIPLLIAIIAGVLVLSGGGYFGLKQYQNYQIRQTQKEKQAQELAKYQQGALEKMAEEQTKSQQKISELEEKIKDSPRNLEITASELDPYLSTVIKISCQDKEGSGSLWNLSGQGYRVLTNRHVVEGESGTCSLDITKNNNNSYGSYDAVLYQQYSWNNNTDAVALGIQINKQLNDAIVSMTSLANESVPVRDLNYKISALKKCPSDMSLGSPVALIGYPAFTEKINYYEGKKIVSSFRTITNGVISSHDTSVKYFQGLSYSNYFVSAKIDSGNSGGIALSKDENGLCVLGIPTWLSIGNYEIQGIVQNIHNVMYVK